ncbi:hypothetical protein KFL_014770010, partial [Klebsormidium nitens]
GFVESPKEKGDGGSDSAVAYVAGRKGKEKLYGKYESRGKGPKCYDCGDFGSIARKCSKPNKREHKREKKKGDKPLKGVAFGVIENVMYVPWVTANLISVSKAIVVASVLLKKNGNYELEVDGEVVLVARRVKGVYKSEVAKVTEHVINRLELQLGTLLKLVRTDRGQGVPQQCP